MCPVFCASIGLLWMSARLFLRVFSGFSQGFLIIIRGVVVAGISRSYARCGTGLPLWFVPVTTLAGAESTL